MDRKQLIAYIKRKYKANPEQLWPKYPGNLVFRHQDNNKWFAIAMEIQKCKLGLDGDEYIDILDIKCEKDMVPSLVETDGFYPAYHMNKANWITVTLNNKLSDDIVKSLIDMSFKLT